MKKKNLVHHSHVTLTADCHEAAVNWIAIHSFIHSSFHHGSWCYAGTNGKSRRDATIGRGGEEGRMGRKVGTWVDTFTFFLRLLARAKADRKLAISAPYSWLPNVTPEVHQY